MSKYLIYKFVLLFFYIFSFFSSADAQNLLKSKIYTIGENDGLVNELFGRFQSSVIASNGILFIGDYDSGKISSYDTNGHHIATVGGRGTEKSKYTSLISIDLSPLEDFLFVFDSSQSRVNVYDTPNLNLAKTINIDSHKFLLRRMKVHNSGVFLFSGYSFENTGLVHLFDETGEYIHSMGEELMSFAKKYDQFVFPQINQGYVFELENGDLVASVFAPYHIALFSIDGEIKWKIKDDLIPDPVGMYIEVGEERFLTNVYPSLRNIHQLGEDKILVILQDRENEIIYWDLRSTYDGTLINRTKFHGREKLKTIEALIGQREDEGLAVLRTQFPFPILSLVEWSWRKN